MKALHWKITFLCFTILLVAVSAIALRSQTLTTENLEIATVVVVVVVTSSYTLVNTRHVAFYDGSCVEIACHAIGEVFYSQDAQYNGAQPSYTNIVNGTITDSIWQKYSSEKKAYNQAVSLAASFDLAGCDGWRMPMINDLYSLILFNGGDPSGWNGTDTSELVPFLDEVLPSSLATPTSAIASSIRSLLPGTNRSG